MTARAHARRIAVFLAILLSFFTAGATLSSGIIYLVDTLSIVGSI